MARPMSRFILKSFGVFIILRVALFTSPSINESEYLSRPPSLHGQEAKRYQSDNKDRKGRRGAGQGNNENNYCDDNLEDCIYVDWDIRRRRVVIQARIGCIIAILFRQCGRQRWQFRWGRQQIESPV
jgi:hypothetical protein